MQAERPRQDFSLRVVGEDVTGTGAVAQFRNRVVDLYRPLEFKVRRRTILVDVTTGTAWPKGWEPPDAGLGIGHVAAGAANTRAMIYIGRRHVPVARRYPDRSSMTAFARQRGEEMPGRLAFTGRAVVTTDASRRDAGVIEARAFKRHRALVAAFAASV